jgi:hypothetical protein
VLLVLCALFSFAIIVLREEFFKGERGEVIFNRKGRKGIENGG